jgi:lysophospholipase L1-like esterase
VSGRALAAVAAAGLLGLSACGGPTTAAVPGAPTGPMLVYVALGDGASLGEGTADPLTQSWPQQLFRTALPESATYVNLAVPGATAAGALTDELPQALGLHPNLATVWLDEPEVLDGAPVAGYAGALRSLLRSLRDGGRTTVLVANLPPLQDLPADRSRVGLAARVAAYNAAIGATVHDTGCVLVDLATAGAAAERAGTLTGLVGRDGDDPSAPGQTRLAALFSAALHASGLLGRLGRSAPAPPA